MLKPVLMLILVVCLSVPAWLVAQTGAARIEGTVKDATGAIVPNATVIADHIDTGNRLTTRSNGIGLFIFPSVVPGNYRVSTEAPGLEKWVGQLQLLSGQDAVIDPVLKAGSTATQVTVAGDLTPLVTETSPTLATVVERQRIEELPLNGRFFQDLVQQMTPGLEGGSGTPKAYGLRDGTVSFVQDGVSITDANVTGITTRPPGMDTIQEFRVEMSVPPARYTSPVTTLLTTRSGTNQWHGGLFYTGRNNGFGVARQRQDFFTTPPQLIRNEYGASTGGPVRVPHLYNGKDRTFFFVAWEQFDLRNASRMTTTLPTLAMQNGDFSQLTDGQNRPITLYDPWTTGTKAQNYSRAPFVGNIIPLSRRSPFASYFYSVLPQPNQPGVNPAIDNNYIGPNPNNRNDYTDTVRIDHRFSDKDQIYGRYTIGVRTLTTRRPNNNSPITSDKLWNAQDSWERMQTGSFSWNHTFSPTFFVETVATGANMDWRFDLLEPSATEVVAGKLGLPNPFNLPAAPNIGNMGQNFGGTPAIPRSENTMPITGEQNYTLVRGKHQFEFGWRFQRMMLDVLPDRPGQGTIAWNSQATGLYDPTTGTAYNALPRTGDASANFFIGVAASYQQTIPAPEYLMRSNQMAGYVQDNWKLGSNLTLNLGVRYDFMQPLLDSNGVNAVFDFKNHALVRTITNDELIRQNATNQAILNTFTSIGVKFETTKEAGISDTLVNVSQRNVSPRVGFAWHRKLLNRAVVVRGGFGAYRYPLATRLFNVQRGNPPLQGNVSYNINSAAQSPDGLANWGLRSVPTVITGTPSAVTAIDPSAANSVGRGVGINVFANELQNALAREWNFTLETEVLRNTLFRVAYVGTAGRNLEQDIQKNGQPNNLVYYSTTGNALPTGAFASVALRDYDQTTYGLIHVYSTTGYSNYNGLQLELQRRFNNGLGFQWFYVLSNAMTMGSTGQILGSSSIIPDPITYFPGAVPQNFDALNRFLNYQRDTDVPKHRVNWNALYDLPFGRGKKFFANASRKLDRIAGGWQLAASSSMNSRYFSLSTDDWGTVSPVEVYGTKYPIQDCRSGTCFRGYLYYNGYIPANQINTHDASGRCTGVCGVPSNYKPSHQPIYPTPANPNPLDPNFSLYGTNLVFVPLKNGTQQRIAYDNGLNPLRNQYVQGPWQWTVNTSMFKVISLSERVKLRLNMDFFNVLNMPGKVLPDSATGLLSLRNSDNAARQLQWTIRLNW